MPAPSTPAQSLRQWLRAPSIGGGIALACFALVWLLRLGYFLALVWPLGALLAAHVARRKHSVVRAQLRDAALGALGFVVITSALYGGLTNRKSVQTFAMSWHENVGAADAPASVELEFVRFPGNFLTVNSSELLTTLKRDGQPQVDVTLELTRDLGCMRGFHETRVGPIGEQQLLSVDISYAVRDGAAAPWHPEPWWCP